jgi:hypothetical protein
LPGELSLAEKKRDSRLGRDNNSSDEERSKSSDGLEHDN